MNKTKDEVIFVGNATTNDNALTKTIPRNYFFYVVQEAVSLLSTVIVIPYISRVLGADNIGIYSYTYSIVTYTILISSLGTTIYGRREMAIYGNNIRGRSVAFFNIVLLRVMMTTCIGIIYVLLFATKGQHASIYRVHLITIIASAFEISWLYQGENKFHVNAILTVVFKLLYCITVIFVVKTDGDLLLYCYCVAITLLAHNIMLWLGIGRIIEIPSIKLLRPFSIFRDVVLLFIPQIAIQIYQVMDKTMLYQICANSSESGYYEQAHNVINIATLLITARGVAITPKLTTLYTEHNYARAEGMMKDSFQFVWLVGAPLVIGMITFADSFVPAYFGSGYDKVISLMCLFAPICLMIGLSNILTVNYISQKRSKEITIAAVSGALVNLILNSSLIRSYMSMGAAFASIVSELVILIIWIYFTRKEFSLKIIFGGSLKKIICAAIALIPISYIQYQTSLLFFVITCICAVAVYCFFLYIFKDQYFIKGLESATGMYQTLIQHRRIKKG